ncbi:MAG: hypothetical protein U0103_04475 [Candidatus Obscuribacterales bacterium]
MTLESPTKCEDMRLAKKSVSDDYEKPSSLGEQSPSGLTKQYLDLMGKQAKPVSAKPSLTAEEFYQEFNDSFQTISRDRTQITEADVAAYKNNPLRLAPSLRTWINPAESRREAMIDELSANFDDLKGLSRASWGLHSGIRKEDVKLFHDIYKTRTDGGCSDSTSYRERQLYEKTASEGIGAGFLGVTAGSILGAEAGARLRMKFLRTLSQCCEGEAGAAFLGRAVNAFPKLPAMLVGAAVLSLAGAAIGTHIDAEVGSSNYDKDREKLNRLMSNLGNASR